MLQLEGKQGLSRIDASFAMLISAHDLAQVQRGHKGGELTVLRTLEDQKRRIAKPNYE